jgi:hypothetical protein
MNTVGKILVVLNLVFALVTGGFLVIDFATRSDYRAEAERREALAKVAAAAAQSHAESARKLVADNKKLREAMEQQIINGQAVQSELQHHIKELDKQFRDQKDAAEKAILNQEKALAEAKRLQGEVQLLNGIVAKREKEILRNQAEIDRYRNEALTQTDKANAAILRAQNLLKQVQEMQAELAKGKAGPGGTSPTANLRDPSYVNPPPAYVLGKILKVDPQQRDLVELNFGSDQGVSKDHTLEVFRLQPRAEYLGRLRVVESTPHRAVARLIRSGSVTHSPLREGDEVSSTVNR